MQIRIKASTGTDVVTYQGYGSDASVPVAQAGEVAGPMGQVGLPTVAAAQPMRADTDPVVFDISGGLGGGSGALFHPFTTTLVEIVLNRVPYPFGQFSQVFHWMN